MAHIVIDARLSGTSTGRYVDRLVEHLHKLKPPHDITVLTKSHRLDYIKSIAPGFKIIKSDYKEYSLSEQLGFLRQLNRLSADLVHFGMPYQPLGYKGAVVTTIHDLTPLRFYNPAQNRLIYGIRRQVYSQLIKQVGRKSRVIITPSEYVKHDVAQYANIPSGKIFVTYEAAERISDPAEAIPRLVGKQFVMYVGRATPHKNLSRLVDAFVVLKKDNPGLMMALAGKIDANYHRLEARVTHKRMADAIVFTDKVSEGELKWLYMNAAAYVFPSLSEGFGLPGLEAMLHGAPVVSSNATSLPEVYGDAAYYFNPKSTYDMATKVADVINSAGRRGELVQKGRAQAAKYSWAKMAKQTLLLYEKSLHSENF